MIKAFTNEVSLADLESEAEALGLPGGAGPGEARERVARSYGFLTWKQAAFYASCRGDGGASFEPPDEVSRFQFLACLSYLHSDSPVRRDRAREMLVRDPGLAGADIFSACCAGNVSAVEALLDADPAAANRRGGVFDWEPLLYACYSRLEPGLPAGHSTLEVGRLLLARGADPNAHYFWGGQYRFTALTGAFGEGEGGPVNQPEHPDVDALARLLLDAGADPNDGQALYNRMFGGGTKCPQMLIEHGLGPEHCCNWLIGDESGKRLVDNPEPVLDYQLSWALRNNHPERAVLLIEAGADVTRTKGERSFFESAMRSWMTEVAELMVERGAERVDLRPSDAFLAACMAGHLEAARAQLAAHPGLNDQVFEEEDSLLQDAAGSNRLGAVRTLLALGVDVNWMTYRSALHEAAWHGHLEMVRLLVEAGAEVSARDHFYGGTPLGWALSNHNEEVAGFLATCPVDILDCLRCDRLDRVEELLDADPNLVHTTLGDLRGGAEVIADNPLENDWKTPLAVALALQKPDAVRLLLARGADPDVVDGRGRTLRQVAQEEASPEIAALLGVG